MVSALVINLMTLASAEPENSTMTDRVRQAQQFLNENGQSGWLLYDFRMKNPIANEMVNPQGMASRRWFYFIPKSGRPLALVHRIEKTTFQGIAGYIETYSSREELVNKLGQILSKSKTILMEYSPEGNNPYVSYLDAGTYELIKSLKVKIESSQEIVQFVLARWSERGYQLHKEAAGLLLRIKDKALDYVAGQVKKNKALSEKDVS